MRYIPLVALALSTALAGPAIAQGPAQAVAPADQLATVMRRLASAPTDLYALIQAGELSIKVDDMSAAAAFFARADRIDGRNGRVKAGMASILVRAERPGEALRYFQQAEGFGLSPSRFAADRGLAFDLLGEQERAQRDYRLALRGATDDETLRRYALSLGISGKRAEALAQLDPLIRRQDRAAWRVRAFVLAMVGDVPGARKIATAVMPAGMAAGLQPFFERLPNLAATDRAFAVHFGEVRPTPARVADARLRPALAPLGPDPYAPVQVASVAAPAPERARGRDARRPARRSGRELGGERVQLALAQRPVAPRPTPPATRPTPARPAPVQLAARAPVTTPAAGRALAFPPTPRPIAAPAAAVPAPVAGPPAPAVAAPAALASVSPGFSLRPDTPTAPPIAVPSVTAAQPVVAAAVPASPAPASTPAVAPVALASAPPVAPPASLASAAPAPAVPAPAPGFTDPVAIEPSRIAVAAVVTAGPPAPAPAAVSAVRSEDSILARIVASISVPAAELGVVGPVRRETPAPAALDAPAARTLAAGRAKAARETADRAAATRTIAAAAAKAKPVEPPEPRRRVAKAVAEAAPEPATRSGRRGKVELAARDAPRGRRALAEEEDAKPASRRKGAEKAEPKKERGEPGRIWVQVAGGANERDLPKAWTAAQRRAAALKGRAAYATPLRATNRVVTGPFKTEAEARAFVNQLAKQGVSAFQFTSAAGQRMTRLSDK